MLAKLADVSRVSVADFSRSFGEPPPAQGRREATGGGQPKPPPSMVRVAAALLVQHPEVADEIKDGEWLSELDLPGMPLLRAVVDLLKARSGLSTAAIIEHFRDSEHQQSISRLATWTHPVLIQDPAVEFRGVLQQLRRAAIHEKSENLLQKQKIYGLTAVEKAELTRLLAEKVGPPTS
jgi:DNA primase